MKEAKNKTLAILGSTGSIGSQTLEIVARQANHEVQGRKSRARPLRVYALAARANVKALEDQVRRFRPAMAVLWEKDAAHDLKGRLRDLPVQVLDGMAGMIAAATAADVQTVVMAVSGRIGLEPTIAALKAGKQVALANKETLVAGGDLVMDLVQSRSGSLIPIDSEHSAIWQCLNRTNEDAFSPKDVERLILTASGGPFRTWSAEQMALARPEDALRHPNWTMGAKITIDSATLMNKGLEVIEAHHLFGMPYTAIDVLIHPQSIIHSMVVYRDGAVLAQLGVPDMRGPIQYALSCPDRWPGLSEPLVLAGRQLTFEEVDHERFPALGLAYRCGIQGGTLPAVLNAANEICVHAFLAKRIHYGDIYSIVADVCEGYANVPAATLETVLQADLWAREEAEARCARVGA